MVRDRAEAGCAAWHLSNGTPRETLRSLLLVATAAGHASDAGALRKLENLITYAGLPARAAQMSQRRALMFDIHDMSMLRIMGVPDAPETSRQDTVQFDIGRAGIAQKTTLDLKAVAFGRWRMGLPAVEVLAAERDRLLASQAYDSAADLDQVARQVPADGAAGVRPRQGQLGRRRSTARAGMAP